jgi:hypothetical protein
VRGFASEHAAYANGWRAPEGLGGGDWTVLLSSGLTGHVDSAWLGIPGLPTVWIEGAGVLPQFTHPQRLASLIAER